VERLLSRSSVSFLLVSQFRTFSVDNPFPLGILCVVRTRSPVLRSCFSFGAVAMALILLGGGVADARGSVGGWVFSRNRGGSYVRNRVVPLNPASPLQQAVRFAVASLTTRWVETLTALQRAAWELYAANVHLPNSMGAPRNVGGIGMYVRSNVPRLVEFSSTLTVVDDAPTVFDVGTFTAPVCTGINTATQEATFTFNNLDAWAGELGAAMCFFGSRPQNGSVNFFKGPYRTMGSVLGAAVPPTSPVTIALPFPYVTEHKGFFRINVTRSDGRLATSFFTFQFAA